MSERLATRQPRGKGGSVRFRLLAIALLPTLVILPLLLGQRGVDETRINAATSEGIDLILHQGDQGAEYDGEAVKVKGR